VGHDREVVSLSARLLVGLFRRLSTGDDGFLIINERNPEALEAPVSGSALDGRAPILT